MPKLIPNIENRVRKLPKPANYSQALLPLFEAVSNAFYAIEDRAQQTTSFSGSVEIRIDNLSKPRELRVEISDNGIGLDRDRYEAFQTIDTDFKRAKGGKGVGRLFWLDAFDEIRVESCYLDKKQLHHRCFRFVLDNHEQIIEESPDEGYVNRKSQGTTLICSGLRGASYQRCFPKKNTTFLRHFSAQFIADFLVGNGSPVSVDIDGEVTTYPEAISDLVLKKQLDVGPFDIEKIGEFEIRGFACDQEASTGLDGNHQLHLLANGRTVESRKIDGLIGLPAVSFDERNDLYFHGCLSSEYFDERVNEGRTAFNIPEGILKDIARRSVEQIRASVLSDQAEEYRQRQRENYENFVARHPIYGFETPEVQLERVPFHANSSEGFATALVKYQIRRDEERQEAIEDAILKLEVEDKLSESFGETLAEAVSELQNSEKLALAQHVVRRKLVLELMDRLLRRVRARDSGR